MKIDFLGSNASMHHIGLGFKRKPKGLGELKYYDDSIQKVSIAFADLNGCPIEVVVPLTDESPTINAVKKGQKLLHICYEVDNISEAITNATDHGCLAIAEPVPAVAFNQRKIAWLFSKEYGLIELLER